MLRPDRYGTYRMFTSRYDVHLGIPSLYKSVSRTRTIASIDSNESLVQKSLFQYLIYKSHLLVSLHHLGPLLPQGVNLLGDWIGLQQRTQQRWTGGTRSGGIKGNGRALVKKVVKAEQRRQGDKRSRPADPRRAVDHDGRVRTVTLVNLIYEPQKLEQASLILLPRDSVIWPCDVQHVGEDKRCRWVPALGDDRELALDTVGVLDRLLLLQRHDEWACLKPRLWRDRHRLPDGERKVRISLDTPVFIVERQLHDGAHPAPLGKRRVHRRSYGLTEHAEERVCGVPQRGLRGDPQLLTVQLPHPAPVEVPPLSLPTAQTGCL